MNRTSRFDSEAMGATVPTRWTKFLRGCVAYQIVRFIVINLKMLRVISKSHG
jgi:hypothetical protein